MIGIAPRNLSNIETGRCFPSPDNLEKISVVLNCKLKDLFDFDPQQNSTNLYDDINQRLNNVSREKLQDLYKIIKVMTDV